MSASEPVTCPFLVLRKTPYSETSLVVTGLSPEHGRTGLMLRGGRKIGGKSFPMVDLFRLLRVTFKPGRGDLGNLSSAEVVTDYSSLASDFPAYATAGWLARFALRNVMPEMPHPLFFRALLVSLHRLTDTPPASEETRRAAILGACIVFLHEGGWLHPLEDAPDAKRQDFLLRMGMGQATMPDLPPETWQQLVSWILAQLYLAECDPPALPE